LGAPIKVVNALWEKRNLGLTVTEITLEKQDFNSLDSIKLIEDNCDYVVIKFSTELNKLIFEVQDLGYTFVELLNTTTKKTKSLPPLTSLEQRFFQNLSTKGINKDSSSLVFDNFENDLFQTDRISVDPFFKLDQTGIRYVGLINDVLENGGSLSGLYLKNELVGFYTYKVESSELVKFQIGAIFNKFKNIGLGYFLNYFQLLEAQRLGVATVSTTYSSNNLAARKVHESLNYLVSCQEYVFVKHL
jgi:hypothetical protein